MIFGLKFVADDFLEEGEVNITVKQDGGYDLGDIVLRPDSKIYEEIYAYDRRSTWYAIEEQNRASGHCRVGFSWIKDANTTLTLNEQNIDYIRMKQTVINVTFYEDEPAGANSLSVNLEDLEMEDSGFSYTFGDEQEEYMW